MKTARVLHMGWRGLIGVILAAVLLTPYVAGAALEEKFDLLQIGTTTYRNVTITTKNKSYIFLLHANGMTNIKVADLPADVRTKLGYEDPAAAHAKTNAPAAWAKQTLAKLESPQVKNVQQQLEAFLPAGWLKAKPQLSSVNQKYLLVLAGLVLALYLFHSYCCMLICQKTGAEPGPLVWVPLLQLIPLLKAASMSPLWLLAFLVPGLNLVAQIIWCVKITQARSKGFGVALLLIFPLSSPFAMLYLAFSGSKGSRKADRRIEIMTLETA